METQVAKQAHGGAIQTANDTRYMIFNQPAMEQAFKLAELMASSKAMVPQHLQGSTGDCMAILLQATRWGMDPFAVAQKTHTIKGVLGYEAQLINAVITANAPVTSRINYDWFGDWSKVVGKFIVKKNGEGKEYRVPGWQLKDEDGLGIRVWATIKGEDKPRVLELLLAQARTRNSTLWADDPKQQLAYLAVKRWARLHTPDVIMGVYTKDELEEREVNPDFTSKKTSSVQPSTNQSQYGGEYTEAEYSHNEEATREPQPNPFDQQAVPEISKDTLLNMIASCDSGADLKDIQTQIVQYEKGTPEYSQLVNAYNTRAAAIKAAATTSQEQ